MYLIFCHMVVAMTALHIGCKLICSWHILYHLSVVDKMKLHIEKELGVPCSEQLQSLFDYYYHNQ